MQSNKATILTKDEIFEAIKLSYADYEYRHKTF